jgi:hypothetical protein
VCNSSSSTSTSISSGTPYPISSYHSFAHKSFSMSVTNCTELKTYKEACQSEHWLKAMDSELDALAKNGTWTIIDLPSNIKPIGSKWSIKLSIRLMVALKGTKQDWLLKAIIKLRVLIF